MYPSFRPALRLHGTSKPGPPGECAYEAIRLGSPSHGSEPSCQQSTHRGKQLSPLSLLPPLFLFSFFLPSLLTCLLLCVYVCIQAHVCSHEHTCMWRPKVDVRCLNHSPPYFFLTGYFTELGTAGLGLDRLTSQGSGHHPNSSSTVLGLQAW